MMHGRVLITGIYYAPEQTGVAVNTTGLAEGLADRGWHVTVLTGVPHYPSWRPEPIGWQSPHTNVEVIRSRHFIPPRQSLALRGAYELSWVLATLPRAVQRRRVDIVLGVSPTLGGGVLAALAAVRWRVPYILMFQDLLGRAARQSSFPHAKLAAAGLDRVERLLATRAERVAVVAEGFRSYLTGAGVPADRIQRVRNPVRTPPPTEDRAQMRRRLGWHPDEFVVVHSGNMGFKQGLENVIRAAALTSRDERIRFILQGDGSQRTSLERFAADLSVANVTFTPLVPAGALPDVLAAADLLLLNQRQEVRDMSLPAKLTTYLATGRPVLAAVARDSETGREVAASGGGVLVEPDHPEALLRAVRDLAAQPDRREALGAAGQAFADAELQPDVTVDQIERLLQTSMSRAAQAMHREHDTETNG